MNEQNSSGISSQTRFSTLPTGSLEILQKRWFCIALEHGGKTFRQETESPTNLLEILNKSIVAWVDYIADDTMKDIPIVAAQMGFSETFVSNLPCCDQIIIKILILSCG